MDDPGAAGRYPLPLAAHAMPLYRSKPISCGQRRAICKCEADIDVKVQDDILGIWGNESVTGKSVASDLVEGKNSLPVLAGLDADKKFAARWRKGPIRSEEVEEIARLLTNEGGYDTAYEASKQMTNLALLNLEEADPQGEAGDALYELADRLLRRSQ